MKQLSHIIIFLLSLLYSNAQQNKIQSFGNRLAESILKKDSIAFQKLILPKEAVIEGIKTGFTFKLSKEEINSALENINTHYDQMIHSIFDLKFLNLTTKTEIFKLDLRNVDYKIVETEETKKDTSLIAVHGAIHHEKFPHFTFYLTNFEDKLYLARHEINISEVNKFEERQKLKKVQPSSDDNGNLVFKGRINLDNALAPKKEILDCILNSIVTIGVEDSSLSSKSDSHHEYINGKWQYTYYVDDTSLFAGLIEFKYEFKIFDGYIDYTYYDFIHIKDDSEFESLGQLPLKINENILKVFTQEQYKEIVTDIYTNQVLAIKRTMRFTNECFK